MFKNKATTCFRILQETLNHIRLRIMFLSLVLSPDYAAGWNMPPCPPTVNINGFCNVNGTATTLAPWDLMFFMQIGCVLCFLQQHQRRFQWICFCNCSDPITIAFRAIIDVSTGKIEVAIIPNCKSLRNSLRDPALSHWRH